MGNALAFALAIAIGCATSSSDASLAVSLGALNVLEETIGTEAADHVLKEIDVESLSMLDLYEVAETDPKDQVYNVLEQIMGEEVLQNVLAKTDIETIDMHFSDPEPMIDEVFTLLGTE